MNARPLFLAALLLTACRDRLPPPILAAPTAQQAPPAPPVAPPMPTPPPFRFAGLAAPVPIAPVEPASVLVLPSPPVPPPVELLPPPDDPPGRILAEARPLLTPEGEALIIEFETGGPSGYNPHPEWPGAASGVTIGVGYDLRFNGPDVIRADWSDLPAAVVRRLLTGQGLSGSAAQARARELRDITIPWRIALAVFERTTVPKFQALSRRTYPGYDVLRDWAQDSLTSLTYNRGPSLVGERRRHMAEIARLAPRRDYDGMAGQERAMVVIWQGTDIFNGMKRRRYAEAALMEKEK